MSVRLWLRRILSPFCPFCNCTICQKNLKKLFLITRASIYIYLDTKSNISKSFSRKFLANCTPPSRKEVTVEEWRPIRSFEGYSVSNRGRVRNEDNGRIMAITRNTVGIYMVGLTKSKVQYKRSLTVLVANAFLPLPADRDFDCPIQLDGDRANNTVENLMWRPRWFAVRYHMQFHRNPRGIPHPIQDVETGRIYETSWEAAVTHGLLDNEIALAIYNRTFVWPTYQEFRILYT